MAKLLIQLHLVAFRCISCRPNPHPCPRPLQEGEGIFTPSQGTTGGGVNPGPIWPCLASFTPSGEAGNGAGVASFGTPLTRMRRASVALVSIVVASLRVARSGKLLILFRFVPFRSIAYRLRGDGGTLIPAFSPQGRRGLPAFAGTTAHLRVNDVCNQCRGWGGDGAMGSCRWVWGWGVLGVA